MLLGVARASAIGFDLVLADEPTGNLDTRSAESVFGPIRQVSHESGSRLLTVTHDLDLARRCDRIIDVADGRLNR